MAMNDDGGSCGGSRNISYSGGREYYSSGDELVDADDPAFETHRQADEGVASRIWPCFSKTLSLILIILMLFLNK